MVARTIQVTNRGTVRLMKIASLLSSIAAPAQVGPTMATRCWTVKTLTCLALAPACLGGLVQTDGWTCTAISPSGTVNNSGPFSCDAVSVNSGANSSAYVSTSAGLNSTGNEISGGASVYDTMVGNEQAGAGGSDAFTLTTETAGPVRAGLLLFDFSDISDVDVAYSEHSLFEFQLTSPWISEDFSAYGEWNGSTVQVGPTVIPMTLGVPFSISWTLSGEPGVFNDYDSETDSAQFSMQFFEADGTTPVDLIDTPEPTAFLLTATGFAMLIFCRSWTRT